MKTKYFRHCWGVFEGGGVRGAALAGAFSAADAAGVSFERVAGTSAGSIVAALIAAGADPGFVRRSLEKTQFRDLLKPADPGQSIFQLQGPSLGLPLLRRVSFGRFWQGLQIAIDAGLHSSEGIREWMEGVLVDVVRGPNSLNKTAITFGEIRTPLYIVATDLISGRAKIWNQQTDSGTSVALAVQCSCSIPFFFQPVLVGDVFYVDGGLLSNLPAFVFADSKQSTKSSLLSRTLCFQLQAEAEPDLRPPCSGLTDFGNLLANAAVGGATELQLSLQSDVHRVAINTGAVKATDFESIKESDVAMLYTSGQTAVEAFIRNERRSVRDAPSRLHYRGFDEMLLLVVQALSDCQGSLWYSGADLYWLYFIFPALAFAVKRGVAVTVLVPPFERLKPGNQPDEMHRRKLIERLGGEVVVEGPPFEGFLFDPESVDNAAAVINDRVKGDAWEDTYRDLVVSVYSSEYDWPVAVESVATAEGQANQVAALHADC
ncbi:MAG TPA: patatin-like phospholipase family protein [Pirellulales bacterium]|jgi:predicted acylesterase/phospholipase RssA|nr:patatin-like phospholipase family protein [Pirellulales bacterium]